MKIQAIRDHILCTQADFGDQTTQAGIVIKSNINKSQGISSRWMQVFEVGPDIDWLTPGEWVLVEYGRWSNGLQVRDDRLPNGEAEVWKVDPAGCLAASDTKPDTLYYNDQVIASERKSL
jgi:hypothetical protein